MKEVTDDFIIKLYDYHYIFEKDDRVFLELNEDEELLQEVKNFNLNSNLLIRGDIQKSIVIHNPRHDCSRQSPYHYVYNSTGLTVKDLLDNIDRVCPEGDVFYFGGFDDKANWYDQIALDVMFGS